MEVHDLFEWCDELCPQLMVMADWMVFCPIVGQVGVARSPEEAELVLVDTAVL